MQYLTLVVLVLASVTLAQAQVIKCTDQKTGNITFSDGGCNSNQKSITIHVAPAMGSDNSVDQQTSYRQNYASVREEQEQRYINNAVNYQKTVKYAADRQYANAYEEGIKRANEERMRNMDKSHSIYPDNTPYSQSNQQCQFIGKRMRCY